MRTKRVDPIALAAAVAVALAGLTALPAARVSAHHGGAVEWGQEELGPLTGTAAEFGFRFPHVQLVIEVPQSSGDVARWTLVTRWTPTILRNHGWSRDSIKPGDEVTVTYLPHVKTPQVGSIRTIEVNGESLPLDF